MRRSRNRWRPDHWQSGAGRHASAASCWIWPGSAWAQAVILPAPRHTTTSPGRAICQIMPGRSPGPLERHDIAMAGALHQAHQHVAIDALDRRLARGIDLGDDHRVGIAEAGREFRLQRGKPAIAMRLHDRDHAAEPP